MLTTNLSLPQKVLIFAIALLLVYFGKSFLMPIAIAAILATLFLPLSRFIERRGVHRLIAGICCLLLFLLVLASIAGLFAWEVNELSHDFEMIKARILFLFDSAQSYLFKKLGITVQLQLQLLKEEGPSLSVIAQKIGSSFTYVITNFLLVLVYMLLFLYYRHHLLQFMLKLVGPIYQVKLERTIHQAAHVSQNYLVGLSKMIVCLWVMYGIGFSALGIKNALFFAVLCGLLEIIPFIGNITGTTLTLLMAAAQGAGAPVLLGVVLTYALVQFIQGWVLEPLIVGSQVKINPLFTIVALVVGELMWGIPGIFLAIPITAIIKTVCDQVEFLHPFGFLIGEVGEVKAKKNIFLQLRQHFK